MKFDFSKSIDTDFRNKLSINLRQLNDNVLYCTRELDKCVKMLNAINNSINLQKQVDEYFDEDKEETSPQTEQVTNLDTNRSSD